MVSTLRKPDLESVSNPDTLVMILRGLYDNLRPSGALLVAPTLQTATDHRALLVCLTKFYGAAYILGAKNLPRPTSSTVDSVEELLPFLVKLYDAVTP